MERCRESERSVTQGAASICLQVKQTQDASALKGEVGGNKTFEALPAVPPAAKWFSRGSRKKEDLWIYIAI